MNPDDNNSNSTKLIQLERELISQNPNIFEGITPKRKKELLKSISITMIQEKSHSGPLPDAETLIKYDSVIPNGADRIMKMAENQQEHRMIIEKKIIFEQSSQSKLGQ
jgi:uncharacterized membrane protein